MTYRNLEIVALNHDISEYELKEGDTGTVVDVYNNERGYEVEFINSRGETIALLTLNSYDLRPVKNSPIFRWDSPILPEFQPSFGQFNIYPTINNSYEAGTQNCFSQQI